MQDKIHKDQRVELDPDARLRLVRQMEQQVTMEIKDKDYRSVYMPCLPLDVTIKHWQ